MARSYSREIADQQGHALPAVWPVLPTAVSVGPLFLVEKVRHGLTVQVSLLRNQDVVRIRNSKLQVVRTAAWPLLVRYYHHLLAMRVVPPFQKNGTAIFLDQH